MKILKKYGCLSKAQIQTLIDNELDKKTFAKYSAHIEKCPYCQQRVNAKKKEIEKVADSMRVLESYSVPNNLNKSAFYKRIFSPPCCMDWCCCINFSCCSNIYSYSTIA